MNRANEALEQEITQAVEHLRDLCLKANKAMLVAIATEHTYAYEYQLSNVGFKVNPDEERFFVPVQTAAALCCLDAKSFEEHHEALLHITKQRMHENPKVLEKIAREQMQDLMNKLGEHEDALSEAEEKEKSQLH